MSEAASGTGLELSLILREICIFFLNMSVFET